MELNSYPQRKKKNKNPTLSRSGFHWIYWQIDLLPWSSINAFRLALVTITQNGEWPLKKSERLLLEQERRKASRPSSAVSRLAISWLSDKWERNTHLLFSLYIGNALLVRNSILGSGENYSTEINLDLLNKICNSISSKTDRQSLQRSLKIMLSTSHIWHFGCPLPTSLSPKALY